VFEREDLATYEMKGRGPQLGAKRRGGKGVPTRLCFKRRVRSSLGEEGGREGVVEENRATLKEA